MSLCKHIMALGGMMLGKLRVPFGRLAFERVLQHTLNLVAIVLTNVGLQKRGQERETKRGVSR